MPKPFEDMTYDEIVEQGLWLEDRRKGRYSRYALGEGEETITVWVDHDSEEVADPDCEGEDDEEAGD